MGCNGFNHPKNCKCNFRGGHPRARPPTWNGWKRKTAGRYVSKPYATCPVCHADVYYVRGKHGGGAYFDLFGPPWPKHACTDKSRHYSPYGRSGKPKLRNVRSEFERDGWLPFFIRNIELLAMGTIIHGVAIDNPTVMHFGTNELHLSIDTELPIYFRPSKEEADIIELNFFPSDAEKPVTHRLFNDCFNEVELALR